MKQMKKHTIYEGVYEGAFKNKIRTEHYTNAIPEKVKIRSYRLNNEEACQFLSDDNFRSYHKERLEKYPESWLKLIITDFTNIHTQVVRHHVSTSVRPYRQGYGCDGTTDDNIHLIAKTLAERNGLNYLEIYGQAYPESYAKATNQAWFDFDDFVYAETVVPDEIDPDVALRDLEQINNYSMAMELGIALFKVGGTMTNWIEKKAWLEDFKVRINRDMARWFREGRL